MKGFKSVTLCVWTWKDFLSLLDSSIKITKTWVTKRWLSHSDTPHVLSCTDCNNVCSPRISLPAHHLLINRLSKAQRREEKGRGAPAAAFLLSGHVEIRPLCLTSDPNGWLNQTFAAANTPSRGESASAFLPFAKKSSHAKGAGWATEYTVVHLISALFS